MRYRFVVATGLLAVSVQAGAVVGAAGQTLPVRNGRPVVAAVNADTISLDEFVSEVGSAADRARLLQGRATAADLEALDRLVTIKLIVQDATSMGLAEAAEIRKQVDVTSREILREVLYAKLTQGVRPDPAAVDKIFKDKVRQWKTTSLLFSDKAAAERARKEIAGGAAFADVAARAAAAKAARTDGDNAYHPRTDYLPQILEAMAPLQVGQVSPVIQIPAGFVVLRVVDMRYPPNAEALAAAQKQVLSQQQEVALKAHEQVLRRQYVTIHKAVLDALSFAAANPRLEALLRDKRSVADIKGSAPLTVGDLTDYLRMQFYHGSDQARQFKKMDEMKGVAFDAMLGRRLLNAEAVRLGI